MKGEYVEESIEVSSDEDVDEEEEKKEEYKVEGEKYDYNTEKALKEKKAILKKKETDKLSSLTLTKKRKRLLDRIL